MNWQEWIVRDRSGALSQWKAAAEGISKLFDGVAGRRIEKEHAHLKERAFWVEIRKPLDGVRLIALQLARDGNSAGQVDLCVWTYAERQDVLKRFERGPAFGLGGAVFARYTDRQPAGTWKYELENEGVQVRGVAYSGKLSPLDDPGKASALLGTTFQAFCDFVIERYLADFEDAGKQAPSAVSATVEQDAEAMDQDWQIEQFAKLLTHLSESQRDAIVKARVGQSKFRGRLMLRWNDSCSVTGLNNAEVLIASHIVPWCQCATADERWDVDNGLLLAPGLDKAFELGYISFEDAGAQRGRIIVASKANWDTKTKLGLDNPQLRIREWHPGLSRYLARHRARWGL